MQNLKNIIEKVKPPVSFDFESGFALKQNGLIENVGQVIKTGAMGINFKDQIMGKKKQDTL